MTAPLVDGVAIRSVVADAARKLRPHAQGKDKYVVDGWARDNGDRIPASFCKLVEIAMAAPLADALALSRALERAILAQHPEVRRLCLTTAIVEDADADALGGKALARYATERTADALDELADSAHAERISATLLAAAADVTAHQLRTRRTHISLAR